MRGRRWLVHCSTLLLVSGLAAADARAHGTITPSTAPRGAKEQFSILVPNASVNVPITGFRLTAPAGVEAEVLGSDRGWSTTVEGRTLVWSGSSIPAGDSGVFEFEAQLPGTGETVTFQGEESYPSVPRSGLFPLTVAMTGSPSTSESRALPITLILVGALTLAALGLVIAASRRRG
jgi:hypothetical protein